MFNAKNSKSNESQNNVDNWWCLKVNERIRCAPFDFRVCNIRFDAVSMTIGISMDVHVHASPIANSISMPIEIDNDSGLQIVQKRTADECACVSVCVLNVNYRLLHAIHQTVEKLFE